MSKFTREMVEAAVAGFEAKKHAIDRQIAELREMLGGAPAVPVLEAQTGKTKRKLSAAAIQRIREGQKRRWAAAKAQSAAKPVKPKRKLSDAGRKAIVAALKKRWAAKKAAAANG